VSTLTLGLLAAASLFAGTVDSIAGGGGLITVPALLSAGLPPDIALATNKGQSVFGSFAAMLAFLRAGRVDKRQALYAFPLALVGSVIGAIILQQIAPDALKPIVIALLIASAALVLVNKPARESGSRRPLVAAALALGIGVYDGVFGPGTGTVLIVGFVALCGRTLVDASADAKVVNFASNIGALALFAANGLVVWQVSLAMAVGQLCGGVIGARLVMRGGERIVRAMVLLASGALVVNLIREML
jgi:uncharacterized membrane protein YfcA